MSKKINIHVGYVLKPLDATNYEIQAKLFDDDRTEITDITRKVSMDDFNSLLVFTEEELVIKNRAEEIIKNVMFKAMAKLLEDEIKRLSNKLTLD